MNSSVTQIGRRAHRSLRAPLFALAFAVTAAPAFAAAPQPRAAVTLDSYSGRWFEIARTPNRIQAQCVASSVDYSIDRDGSVRAVHRCERTDREPRVTRLKGRILDPGVNAKLRLTYAGFLSQEYWIIEQNGAENWAIVGDPTGKYVWLMSRNMQLDDARIASATRRLGALGYDTSRLQFR